MPLRHDIWEAEDMPRPVQVKNKLEKNLKAQGQGRGERYAGLARGKGSIKESSQNPEAA